MKVILNRPHTHEGTAHAIGAEIEMLMHDAEFVVSIGVANFKAGVQRLERAFAKDVTEGTGSAVAEPEASLEPHSPTDDSGAIHE